MLVDVLGLLLGALRLALLTLAVLLLPFLLQLLLLFGTSLLFHEIIKRLSYILTILLHLVGTAIHEFSHAIGLLITFSGVAAIRLLADPYGSTFYRKEPGLAVRVIVPIAPLFGGIVALWLTARYILPGFDLSAVAPPTVDQEMAASPGSTLAVTWDMLVYSFKTVLAQLQALPWDNWRTYVGLYIAVSVGVGLALSPGDVKDFLAALPVSLILFYGLFVGVYLLGDVATLFPSVMGKLLPPLARLTMIITTALLLTLLGLFLCIPLFFLKRIVWGGSDAAVQEGEMEPVHDPSAE
jgi:hypothetical protein